MTTSGSDRPLGPFRLVTVNTAPERAKRIVGRLCEEVKDDYLIDHVANSTSELLPGADIYIPCRRRHTFLMGRLTLFLLVTKDIDGVRAMVEEHKPDILVRAHPTTSLLLSSPGPQRSEELPGRCSRRRRVGLLGRAES